MVIMIITIINKTLIYEYIIPTNHAVKFTPKLKTTCRSFALTSPLKFGGGLHMRKIH